MEVKVWRAAAMLLALEGVVKLPAIMRNLRFSDDDIKNKTLLQWIWHHAEQKKQEQEAAMKATLNSHQSYQQPQPPVFVTTPMARMTTSAESRWDSLISLVTDSSHSHRTAKLANLSTIKSNLSLLKFITQSTIDSQDDASKNNKTSSTCSCQQSLKESHCQLLESTEHNQQYAQKRSRRHQLKFKLWMGTWWWWTRRLRKHLRLQPVMCMHTKTYHPIIQTKRQQLKLLMTSIQSAVLCLVPKQFYDMCTITWSMFHQWRKAQQA